MRKIVLLLLPILMSFTQSESFKDGTYTNKSELIYGIEILNNSTQIKFYLRKSEDDKVMDWKTFKTGTIIKEKNKYYIQTINYDSRVYEKSEKLEFKIKDNIIEFKSFDLLKNFYPSVTIYSNKIKYQYSSENKKLD